MVHSLKTHEINEFINLCQQIDSESDNLLYGREERKAAPLFTERGIKNLLDAPNSNIWIDESSGFLTGYICAIGSDIKRIKHQVRIVIAVRKQFYNHGIGTNLMAAFLNWAKQSDIKRVELSVRADNERAIRLYEKFKFSVEGTKRNSLCINGAFYDELYMANLM